MTLRRALLLTAVLAVSVAPAGTTRAGPAAPRAVTARREEAARTAALIEAITQLRSTLAVERNPFRGREFARRLAAREAELLRWLRVVRHAGSGRWRP